MPIETNRDVKNLTIQDIPETTSEAIESFDLVNLLENLPPPKVTTYSRSKIKKAGQALRRNEGNLKEAITIIHSFRAEHEEALEHVLNFISALCDEQHVGYLSFSRLKRLETIVNKMHRPSLDGRVVNSICITNMNDIAGCRFVFDTLQQLETVKGFIEEEARKWRSLELEQFYDYISHPKENDCGYRCLHSIFYYFNEDNKKYRVEAQLRTRLQHVWATAVEIVDLINQTEIKTTSFYNESCKKPEQLRWERLLRLMSDYIAHEDGVVQLSKKQIFEIKEELVVVNNDINAVEKLSSFEMVFQSKGLEDASRNDKKHVLCVINELAQGVETINFYEIEQEAIQAYNNLEKVYAGSINHRVLLFSIAEVEKLKRAYPNYLGSCSEFVSQLNNAMLATISE